MKNGSALMTVHVRTPKYSFNRFKQKKIVSDIENLTHKTGNFKQFDIFIAMLKSGLLKVSLLSGIF